MNAFVLPYAPSETEGFVPERLERLTAVMQRQIDEKKAPGLSMLIARHGKFVYRQSLGALRPDGPPMPDDAIFRIYSMTKPIVSVAAMMLVEEGRLSIIDPVSAYIPAFADVKVGVPNGDRLELAPLRRPVTIQDLMRHTSGLTYGFTGVSPVQKLTKAADLRNPDRTTAEIVEAIAALPLMHQPGDAWEYGFSTDVLGRIVEIVEGARLSDVLRARIFGPLGMTDTAFFTPESKLARRADPFSFDFMNAAGVDPVNTTVAAEVRVRRRRPRVDARRLHALRRHAEQRRRPRRRAHPQPADARLHGERPSRRERKPRPHLLWPGHGFGLGFAVRTDPGKAPTAGSVGEFFWGGMMGTAFWISPRDSLFAILMVQTPEIPRVFPHAVPQPGQRRDCMRRSLETGPRGRWMGPGVDRALCTHERRHGATGGCRVEVGE